MRILVCIKRVPAPGARIVLSEDARSVDASLLSFTISPHEECAVEAAVQIAEVSEGSVTVLTLGPPEAEEQLRSSLAAGADEAVLIPIDGDQFERSKLVTHRTRSREIESNPYVFAACER